VRLNSSPIIAYRPRGLWKRQQQQARQQ